MRREYLYYFVFGISFFSFGIVQDFIRPNYNGASELVIYFLGVIPNFFPGIGLPSLLYVLIPELFPPTSSLYKERLKWSMVISMVGLVGNEFLTIYTPGRGVFDWNDILWTFIGGMLFYFLHKRIQSAAL